MAEQNKVIGTFTYYCHYCHPSFMFKKTFDIKNKYVQVVCPQCGNFLKRRDGV